MAEKIVEVKDLFLKIGRKTILDGIGLELVKGESVLIAGRNGSGKSTLLKCLADVILPDKGRIVYHECVDKRKIGFISDRVSLLENFSIRKGIGFHSSVYHIQDYDDTMIKKLNLDMDQKIKHLSAGQRVLFHLSLLVAQEPEVLLVDEIIHTIDPYLREFFLETVIGLMDRLKTTVVLVNHTFSEVEKIPERIMIMENGRFILDEKCETLRNNIKKVMTGEKLPAGLPCIFEKESQYFKQYFIYPFKEEFREEFPFQYEDMDLNEIMKAFIGGQYDKKRV